VGKIDHSHHAKNERQAGSKKEQYHRPAKSAHGLSKNNGKINVHES
jgi:hypothetical protein